MVWFVSLVVTSLFCFGSCATMFRTNNANVVAASGTTSQVKVLQNDKVIFEGPLPVQIPMYHGGTFGINRPIYTIQYTAADGQTKEVIIEQRFNGWVIGSALLLFPLIGIDALTGSMYTFKKITTLPISYSDSLVIFFVENIPESEYLQLIGNIYNPEESQKIESSILFAMN